MKNKIFLLILCLLSLATVPISCTQKGLEIDGLKRARIDNLNRLSFQNRFRDTKLSEKYAQQALEYINDSLPDYHDGRLRAWNNIATSLYFRARHDSAFCYLDSILNYNTHCSNMEVERTLALLLEARLKQRNCDIAGSYKILYDIERSGILEKDNGNMLYNLAKSEFYITTVTLNYHYRTRSLYEHSDLMNEMEHLKESLKCDYAENMSFNYALAYGYYSLCNDSTRQAEYLNKSLHYCMENLSLMNDSLRYSTYHLGDTYQLIGFMLWGPHIKPEAWEQNRQALDEICELTHDAFGFDVSNEPDITFAFLHEATALFFLHDDPYQRLGAVVATGRYCMKHGDTATARDYFYEALIDTTLLGVAPKFESMLYEGLLTSGCATSQSQVEQWTSKEIELLNYIKQNEKADFLLQKELDQVRENSNTLMFLSFLLLFLAIGLTITLILLRRRTKALQRETAQLQKAKRHDVERIANVETCLSVLRHDINPFISYLQNDNLPEELKREVTAQLIRTFENIKNWTNLSIPTGLQFRCSNVALSDVFNSVASSVNNFRGSNVTITFDDTPIHVKGDRLLLEIMVRNLVNNAIQYTEKGSIRIWAEPYAENRDFVKVSIKDTGCGIPAEELENLFRTDKKPKEASGGEGYGSGFGLILCRYIIKKHDDNTQRGCRIWAESTEGEGSTFNFILSKS